MALPKRRSSKAKVRTRRQQWMRATGSLARTECAHCGATILPHRFCPKCRRYGELTLRTRPEKSGAEPRGRK